MQGETPKRRRRIQAENPAIEPDPTGSPSTQPEQPVLPAAQTDHMLQPDAQPHRRRRQSIQQTGRLRYAAKAGLIRAWRSGKRIGTRVIKGVLALGGMLGDKCRQALGRLAADRRRRSSPMRQTAVTIEPVRPNTYHGNAQRYRQRKIVRRKKQREWAFRLTCALLIMVALFSLFQIGSIVVRSIRTKLLNAELSQMHGQADEQQEETNDTAQLSPAFVIMTSEPQQTAEPAENASIPGTAADAVPAADSMPAADTPLPAQERTQASPAPEEALPVVRNTKYHEISGTPLPRMEKLYEQNQDLVAWIKIPDVLDQPVVYKDNSYYLTRDFYKQKNTSGTVFLDKNHPFRERTQNLLLHGHNMKDGTMFGHLTRYLSDSTYIINHPFISFDTLWQEEQYVIFAILNVSLDVKNERFFNYFTYDRFETDEQFDAYIRQLQLHSEYAIPLDVDPSDALLTLSTCLEEDRLVIVARRLREGETRSELRSIIRTVTRQ